MPYNNSTNLFGITPYIVGKTGAYSYSTVQSAMNAASAAGGGIVYVRPGTYAENLSFPTNVNVIGSDPGIDINGNGTYSATILGTHTFPAGNSNVCIQNLIFGNPGSGTSPLFTLAPSSGACAFDIADCEINDSINSSNPSSCISCVSTGSGTADVTLKNVTISYSTLALNLAGSSVATVSYSSIETSPSITPCIFVAAGGSLVSSYTSYDGSIRFSGNGNVSSVFDNFNSNDPSGFYIYSTGAYGQLQYADSIATGTATGIDTQVTKTIYTQNPDTIPRTNGQLAIGSTGSYPVANTLTAGTNVAITNGPGSISIASIPSGGGVTWNAVSANTTLAVNNGYIVTSGTPTLTLPATAAVGTVIYVLLRGGTSWKIGQAAGQQIFSGNYSSTAGTGGSITSSGLGDAIELVCTTANTTWGVFGTVGNLLVT